MALKATNAFINFILIAFCILKIIPLAFGSCRIELPEDISLRPNFVLKIGSRKIDLILSKADTYLTLFENQEIKAKCDTKFKYPERCNDKNNVILTCTENYIFINNNPYDGQLSIECSSQKWNLYETRQNLVWCPTNITSYILARPVDSVTTKFQYLAGICYDTFNFSFKSLLYTIAPKHSEHLHPNVLTDFYKPSLELQHLKDTFSMKSIMETDYDTQSVQDWIKYSKYNYSSVIQNSLLENEFNRELGSLLHLAWWPSLRLGNWKRYEIALARHVESQNESYDILSGVSAAATVPIIEVCQSNYTLKEITDNRNHKIPLYVWNYLRSRTNRSEEIVIIGVNTPFYEFYSEKDIVFCSDKCQDIPWLKKVSATFRYSALGVIFCCSSEDVKSSKYLDGFPATNINEIPIKSIKDTFTIDYELNSYETGGL